MNQEEYQRVAILGDLPRGKTLCVVVDNKEILLCHTNEGIFAVDNLCSHAEARLCEGKLKGQRILCPLHGAAFDVRDGSALSLPAKRAVQSFPVKIQGEDILVLTGGLED